MRILIAEHRVELGRIWARYLQRLGVQVTLATSSEQALHLLRFQDFDLLVLELVMPDGGAIVISDFVTYRYPDVPILAITSGSFFANGSVFELIPNARTLLRMPFRIDDLAALIDHYALRPRQADSANRAIG